MTSITQLLSPWPAAKPQTIVLRDHPEYPPPQTQSIPPPPSYQPASTVMPSAQSQGAPTSPSAASPQQTSEHSDIDQQTDGRKGYGKRELSTSKRAAQNRAAQRAFRQRKEGYIKKLEEQVRDYQILSENFKAVQAENYQLRDYIINLQSRLLESQHEVPPPPSNVDGLQPGKAHQPHHAQIQPPQQIPAVNSQQHRQTLPRIAEMGSAGTTPPHDQQAVHPTSTRSPTGLGESYGFEQAAKRVKTSPRMTPAQSALQGTAVLSSGSKPLRLGMPGNQPGVDNTRHVKLSFGGVVGDQNLVSGHSSVRDMNALRNKDLSAGIPECTATKASRS